MINAVILKQVHKPAVGILAVNDPPDVFQHGAQNYIAVCLEHGPLATARMDQGGRCSRVPASRQGYRVRLHQSAEASGTATEASRDHLCIYGEHSQTAGDAGGIIEP